VSPSVALLIAALVANAVLSGANLAQSIAQLPARRRLIRHARVTTALLTSSWCFICWHAIQ